MGEYQKHYEDDRVTLWRGDCLDVLKSLPDASVDAVVTDPPYGIRFMGEAWDGADIVANTERWRETNPMPPEVGGPNGGHRSAASEAGRYRQTIGANRQFQDWVNSWALECLRVLKPGGHLLASGSSRTWHRLTAGIEDAGFEIRDSIAWMYGSGFPKSLDVSKAIDKAAGVQLEVTGSRRGNDITGGRYGSSAGDAAVMLTERDQPATLEAAVWQGWGTALKPGFEPIVVARKPLDGTVAANVLAHGTGALNIDGCRVGDGAESQGERRDEPSGERRYADRGSVNLAATPGPRGGSPTGRWPTNVVLDVDQAAAVDEQTGILTSGYMRPEVDRQTRQGHAYGPFAARTATATYGDSGGASRFFYVAKAARNERPVVDGVAHPTVKPLTLMRWLVRLVTPPGGTVLEPFAGSGTTVEACIAEGVQCIAIERGEEYLPLIEFRIRRGGNLDYSEDTPEDDPDYEGDIFSSLGIEAV